MKATLELVAGLSLVLTACQPASTSSGATGGGTSGAAGATTGTSGASPCAGIICTTGEACANGSCFPLNCASHSCGAGQVCLNTTCLDITCVGLNCSFGDVCLGGTCVPGTATAAGSSTGTSGMSSTSGHGSSTTATATSGSTSSAATSSTTSGAHGSSTTGGLTGTIWYVTTAGSDSNPCTQASPCATPDYAFNNVAGPGDTVLVAAGIYDYGMGAATFNSAGAAGNYVTVTCVTRGACKIQNSAPGNATVVGINGEYTTFDGFEVTSTSSTGNNYGVFVNASFVNITRNTIHHIETDCGDNGGGGIQVYGSGSSNIGFGNITMDSNLIYDISWPNGSPSCGSSVVQTDGILCESAGANNVVTNNIIYHTSGGWGILVGNFNGPTTVIGNVISNNLVFSTARGGIISMNGGMSTTNNIVVYIGTEFGECAYTEGSGESQSYADSDLWNNGGGNYCIAWGTSDASIHAGDLAVDPALGTTFVNWQADGTGDYHEIDGSPTIGAGSNVGGLPDHDYDGKPRPSGGGIDIGPYQH